MKKNKFIRLSLLTKKIRRYLRSYFTPCDHFFTYLLEYYLGVNKCSPVISRNKDTIQGKRKKKKKKQHTLILVLLPLNFFLN